MSTDEQNLKEVLEMIKRVWACFFSPSGHTKKVVSAAAHAAADALGIDHVDIYDWTLPAAREACPAFTKEDLVFAATPTYAGRVPNKIMPYVRDVLKGNGAYGAAIVTYGNRSFDESLMELGLLMEANGFAMVGAGAACCQHVFSKIMAAGRPDASDLDEARAFGEKTAKKAADADAAGQSLPPYESLGTPGHNPVGPYYTPLTGKGSRQNSSKPSRSLTCLNALTATSVQMSVPWAISLPTTSKRSVVPASNVRPASSNVLKAPAISMPP